MTRIHRRASDTGHVPDGLPQQSTASREFKLRSQLDRQGHYRPIWSAVSCVPLSASAASSADVIFGADTAGTLRLDDSFDFSRSIAGITNDDKVEIGDIWFSTGTSAVYQANQDGSGGTLVVSDGTHDATLHLLGAYDADSFTVADDGTGRTVVAYSPGDDFSMF